MIVFYCADIITRVKILLVKLRRRSGHVRLVTLDLFDRTIAELDGHFIKQDLLKLLYFKIPVYRVLCVVYLGVIEEI